MAIAANMHIPYKIEIGEDDVRDLHAEDHFGKGKCAVTIIHTHARAHTHSHPHSNTHAHKQGMLDISPLYVNFIFNRANLLITTGVGVCLFVCNNIVVAYLVVVVVNESVVSLCCSNYHYGTNER